VIELSCLRKALAEVVEVLEDLDGRDLDEVDALTDQSKGAARVERARMSQDLNFMADRLALAEQLVRHEYWKARGESDILIEDAKSLGIAIPTD
jgi:hypothetical protein